MKYQTRVTVSLKEGVLDPQGQTINKALTELGFGNVLRVNTGKIFMLEIESETEEDALRTASAAATKLLANPVIEQFKVEVSR